jgi:hypothetical protein
MRMKKPTEDLIAEVPRSNSRINYYRGNYQPKYNPGNRPPRPIPYKGNRPGGGYNNPGNRPNNPGNPGNRPNNPGGGGGPTGRVEAAKRPVPSSASSYEEERM